MSHRSFRWVVCCALGVAVPSGARALDNGIAVALPHAISAGRPVAARQGEDPIARREIETLMKQLGTEAVRSNRLEYQLNQKSREVEKLQRQVSDLFIRVESDLILDAVAIEKDGSFRVDDVTALRRVAAAVTPESGWDFIKRAVRAKAKGRQTVQLRHDLEVAYRLAAILTVTAGELQKPAPALGTAFSIDVTPYAERAWDNNGYPGKFIERERYAPRDYETIPVAQEGKISVAAIEKAVAAARD